MPEKLTGLSFDEIERLLAEDGRRRPGRPLLRDIWAKSIWDALWSVHPQGLAPAELREITGLDTNQLLAGARYLRSTVSDAPHPPVVYVRSDRLWYIAPTWGNHARDAVRAGYLQTSATQLQSAVQLLTQAEEAFPVHARRIRKLIRNANYLREEANDLVQELGTA